MSVLCCILAALEQICFKDYWTNISTAFIQELTFHGVRSSIITKQRHIYYVKVFVELGCRFFLRRIFFYAIAKVYPLEVCKRSQLLASFDPEMLSVTWVILPSYGPLIWPLFGYCTRFHPFFFLLLLSKRLKNTKTTRNLFFVLCCDCGVSQVVFVSVYGYTSVLNSGPQTSARQIL